MEYTIVIPVYNESDKIANTINQVITFMRTFSEKFEVIVVDDGSSDNTVQILENLTSSYKELVIIKNKHKGKSAAVWSGMYQAKGDYIYMCDADLATPIEELKKLASWITEHNYDIVIASREGAGAVRINEPLTRHLAGRIFNAWVQAFALPGIKDSQCGFKLFRREPAKVIFSKLQVYGENAPEINRPQFGAFDVEVLYLAKKFKYKVKELPVIWKYVKTTRLNFFENTFRMSTDVLKVRINDLLGRYK
ncbi:glycosyltransferase family 2 protein [Candidatus Nomurabacteria bacterium]|uniref:dolichyl-phosphate beta-glucosyltransferase n=1 Tax=candidate division WWE3 bacterium TaxID=2053526 RepID=A0A955IW14_UNCKA|nr:glycosyltransferase family 2 protein [candidate division WWE3 bacterium]MCB9824161.1 glycosyltransferase family 2 protein [Candidatus Nomurabacteria bacterium]MCB9826868.1 glycosyltransferase family 2 protein [Candidatus Nomurabacteria bacterium]MCB9828102.1 glycosyltransferase family 2 protein [Candidatus Nomurabacteria bacterium]HXK52454.1 glycosyltransferase family 2 protein [bacterium]